MKDEKDLEGYAPREIKFRAWAGGKMWYQGMFEFQQVGGTVLGNRSKFKLWEFEGIESGENLFAPIDLDTEIPQLMQFTGLKDGNGKEIYEGDMLERSPGDVGFVRFRANYGRFECNDGKSKYGTWTLSAVWCSVHLVIGNIYENPELLPKGGEDGTL